MCEKGGAVFSTAVRYSTSAKQKILLSLMSMGKHLFTSVKAGLYAEDLWMFHSNMEWKFNKVRTVVCLGFFLEVIIKLIKSE